MNSFKGHLTNAEACDVVHEALKKNQISSRMLPIGDGGAGTLEAVRLSLGGKIVKIPATAPLGATVEARVLCLPDDSRPEALYIESAEACGYSLVSGERDAMRASSRGVGDVLAEALKRWGSSLKKVYVGLGDSATSDAGMGMLTALGYTFVDQGGKTLWGNAEGLRNIHAIRGTPHPLLRTISFSILCDVLNPLCGPKGSARVFAPQKGATLGQVPLIEQGMENFSRLILESGGRDLRQQPMTGAAGGLAAAFRGFFNAELVLGSSFLLDLVQFDRFLEDCDFVVTGEGKVDAQTVSGKAPFECVRRAKRMGKKSYVIAGVLGEGHEALARETSELVACGKEPNPREALYGVALGLFSNSL